jgi:hypothetical protein
VLQEGLGGGGRGVLLEHAPPAAVEEDPHGARARGAWSSRAPSRGSAGRWRCCEGERACRPWRSARGRESAGTGREERERDIWFAASPGMGDGEGRLHFAARAAAAAGV